MPEKQPVLVACRHLPKYFDSAKKKIDQYFNEGRKVLAIEQYPGQGSPFFGGLIRYAESKGMKVIPIDSPFGAKKTERIFDRIEFASDLAAKIPSERRDSKKLVRKLEYQHDAIAHKRTEIMVKKLKRILLKHPDCLIMVALGHSKGIRKAIPVKFEKVGRMPIIRGLKLSFAGWRRKRKKARARKQRKRVLRKQ